MKTRVLVAGLESSGNHWMASILEQHPMLEVTIESFPRDMGPDRRYPFSKEPFDVFVVMTRDSTCQRRSVIRRGYEKGTEDKFPNSLNIEAVVKNFANAKKVIFGSYEALVRYQQHYLDWLFAQIGVPSIIPNTEYKDANLQYLIPERKFL